MSRRRVKGTGQTATAPRFERTVGIDVDSRFCVVAFWQADTPTTPTREYTNDLTGLPRLAADCAEFEPEAVVLESTGQYSLLPYDVLATHGLNVMMVNPLTVKALLRVEGKADRTDAVTLARLAGSFQLRTSNVPTPWMRECRALFRILDQAAQNERRWSNRMYAQLRLAGCNLTDIVTAGKTRDRMLRAIGHMPPEHIAAMHPHPHRRAAIAAAIPSEFSAATLRYLDVCIEQIDLARRQSEGVEGPLTALANDGKVQKAMQFVLTCPLTDELLALRMLGEMGINFTDRFASPARFCSAIGCAPRTEVSGGKLLKVKARHGRARLLHHMVQKCKGGTLHLKSGSMAYAFEAYQAKAGYSKALLWLAHVMAEAWWWTTKKEEPWSEAKRFGRLVNLQTGELLDR